MNVETRMLGISYRAKGTRYIDQMLNGQITATQLNERQREEFIEAWETRSFVKKRYYEGPNISKEKVVPNNTRDEDMKEGQVRREDYTRIYVQQIEERLKAISYIVSGLGISLKMRGSYYIEQMINGKLTNESLTNAQREKVIEAWQTGVCDKKLQFKQKMGNVKIVHNSTKEFKPGEMTDKEYNRLYVAEIEKFIMEKRIN